MSTPKQFSVFKYIHEHLAELVYSDKKLQNLIKALVNKITEIKLIYLKPII